MKPIVSRLSALMKLLAFFLAFAALTSCGGGGGSSDSPNNAVAAAGDDQDVATKSTVTLDGSGSSDPENDSLTYTWTQTYGPDVTGGSGKLSGVSPSFTAPTDVSTVLFDLTVSDGGSGTTTADSVQINILEHTGPAYYVDGDNGSDSTGDGSRTNPFATISYAISEISNNNFTDYDIYVKTLANNARYDETGSTLDPNDTTSLYGGYGADWVRDVDSNRTGVDGNAVAVRFANVSSESWFSGFDLIAADGANASSIVSGVSVESGTGTLYVQDNTVTAGNVGPGVSSGPASSYGLRLASVSAVRVLRNTISAGNGGNGQNGAQPAGTNSGLRGTSATGNSGGSGGTAGNPNSFGNAGGHGGAGGIPFVQDGIAGKNGSSLPSSTGGGTGGSGGSFQGGSGGGGYGGSGGPGGNGGTGSGSISAGGYFSALSGHSGFSGNSGAGGGGGGGGDALAGNGGGGGGGGGGGHAGQGGSAGVSGGASIGILVTGITDAIIDGNTVTSATGGNGGRGGAGGTSGHGGDGGQGYSPLAGYDGGSGGGGGKGGQGGQGGGGGGGPSNAIMVGASTAPVIQNNTLTSQAGGTAGTGGTGGRDGNAGTAGTSRTSNGIGAKNYANSKAANGTAAEGGYSYGIFDVDPNDGLAPALNNNTVNVGIPGANGQSGEQNF